MTKTRVLAVLVALGTAAALTACTSEDDNNPPTYSSAAPSMSASPMGSTMPTSTPPKPPTSQPTSQPTSDVPPTATPNASTPAADAGVAACGTFDGKLGPDLPVPDSFTDSQLAQLRKDFAASAFPDIARTGVLFVDNVKKAKDGDDNATADDLSKSGNDLATACQAAVKSK